MTTSYHSDSAVDGLVVQPALSPVAVVDRFTQVRSQSVALCDPLGHEDFVLQSMPDASPVKWHLAHTTWFFENFVLRPFCPDYGLFHPSFGFLFNSYYNAVGTRHPRPERGLISRPTVDEVWAYRQHVDTAMARLLESGISPEQWSVVELGLHHEQQHQELLLTDIKHAFSRNPLLPAYADSSGRIGQAMPMDWLSFPGGVFEIGASGLGFSFDNERPRHKVYLQPFALGSRLVTNGEYLDFMKDGGYYRPELWLSDGWDTRQAEGWTAPLYWTGDESGYREFTLSGARNVELSEPVCHLSFYEADAFARWAGARLPTEFEWEIAAQQQSTQGNFVEQEVFHPTPASSREGTVRQIFGDVWEWTSSPYVAYPGFRPAAGALGEYNGKFMCNQIVLRGGSCVTPRSHMRDSYRNFFHANKRWQFTGIRLAQDV